MAFNIEISDTTRFTVKFSIKDDKGVERPGSIDLIAERLDTDEYKDRLESCGMSYADFLATIVRGWENVRDGSGTPVPFSEDALRRICKLPGMASLMFKTYGAEVSVKEKN